MNALHVKVYMAEFCLLTVQSNVLKNNFFVLTGVNNFKVVLIVLVYMNRVYFLIFFYPMLCYCV